MKQLFDAIMFDSIYGTVGIGGAAFGLVWLAGRLSRRNFHPEIWAVSVFFLALLVLPSIPRFEFERKIRSDIEESPWVKVVQTAEYGSLSEPVTWFSSSTGFFRIVWPGAFDANQYWETFLRYEEEPELRILDVDCIERIFRVSLPDDDGTFRTFPDELGLSNDDFVLFCETDWDIERQKLRESILRGNT